jgi:hypothetical protein
MSRSGARSGTSDEREAIISSPGAALSRPLTLLAALALFAGHAFWFRGHIVDDAFITFRYACHLAEGAGAVFNPGEPVEGYTNFLWMILLSAACALGADLPRTAVWLGALCSAATVILVARGPWPGLTRKGSAAAAILLACNGSFVLWGKSGLEGGLFSLLLVTACLLFEIAGPHGRAGLLKDAAVSCAIGLAVLTRPEGAILLALLAGLRAAERRLRPVPADAALVVPALALVGVQLIFRWVTYGALLPNTYHAKVGGSAGDLAMGLSYLAEAILVYGPLLFAALLGLMLARPLRAARLPALVVAAYAAAFVWEGGDSFPLLRFFAPLMPFLCLLAGHAIQSLIPDEQPIGRAALAGGALCLITALPSFHGAQHDRVAHDAADVEVWTELGRHLSAALAPGDAVALNPVGAVGYFSGRPIIDMLGINDAVIARSVPVDGPAGHRRANGRYVLSRNPTLILIGWNHPLPEGEQRPLLEPVYASDRQVLDHPDVRRRYQPVILQAGPHRFAALRRLEE